MAQKNDRNTKYTYRVAWSEEDAEYVGLCAEFPSISWLASTPEAALKGVCRLVHEVVDDAVDDAVEAGVSFNRLATAKLSHSLLLESHEL